MKQTIITIATLALFALLSTGLIAQNPPHPNGGSGPGSGNTPVGGGAPIDGGLSLLLIMGAAYGTKKALTLKINLSNTND
ncbi:MAG: hypothetical protein KDC05_12820 [Bacteroidales bacterium]|nr:hypothetical protein [Bacteroidales bacterium]